MAKVISMINWKGGVGKSTLSLHLAVGIAKEEGKKVLVIDLDPQCNLSYLALGVSRFEEGVYKEKTQPTLKDLFDSYFASEAFDTDGAIVEKPITSRPKRVWANVDVLLSHHELVLVDMRLARERKSGTSHQEETRFELDKVSIIYNALKQVEDEYDYVILDCPPNINLVTQNAFFASQYYIIPAIPDFLSTVGISLIKKEMEKLNENFKGMISYSGAEVDYSDAEMLGIVFNMVTEYREEPKRTHKKTIGQVELQHPGKVFDQYITIGDGISVAAENNMTVFSYKHLSRSMPNAEKQSDYMEALVSEVLARF